MERLFFKNLPLMGVCTFGFGSDYMQCAGLLFCLAAASVLAAPLHHELEEHRAASGSSGGSSTSSSHQHPLDHDDYGFEFGNADEDDTEYVRDPDNNAPSEEEEPPWDDDGEDEIPQVGESAAFSPQRRVVVAARAGNATKSQGIKGDSFIAHDGPTLGSFPGHNVEVVWYDDPSKARLAPHDDPVAPANFPFWRREPPTSGGSTAYRFTFP